MTATDEAAAIEAARNGSTGAFERLYRLHSPRVYGLCLRLSDNQADAQDAMQETFIKAWRALSRFRGESSLSTWLHRIAFNETLRIRRKRGKEHGHLHLAQPEPAVEDASLSEIEQVERAIRALPERAREVLVLTKIYGYTHREAASFLNVAEGTCKVQVHRAMKLLRKLMPGEALEQPATGESTPHES